MPAPTRRGFVAGTTALAFDLFNRPAKARILGANRRVRVGVMGLSRGLDLARGFAQLPDVEVAYLCDVDQNRVARGLAALAKTTAVTPASGGDFRRMLDDGAIDALANAACNHWHAPAAILACAAGKHVYVEKPCSHTPQEGEWLVAAAAKHRRFVQMGNQRRSWPKIVEAIARLRAGELGRVYFAQAWYVAQRGSIGRGAATQVPAGMDYELWQGPAPRRPFQSNFLHYNWHWFWHWGNGELGNNGVHMIDVCRWGLETTYPEKVTSTGGRFHFDDDQETPDTHVITCQFPGRKTLVWQGLSCVALPEKQVPDVVFVGEKGSLAIRRGNYALHDRKGKVVEQVNGPDGDADHLANFVGAIREEGKLNSPITEGHISTLLCHLGNIAHRVGRNLHCRPADGHILDDAAAAALWSREYAPGWEPRV